MTQAEGTGEIGRRALEAIAARDWAALRPLLHPYLRWTDTRGTTIRGRSNVLTMLGQASEAPPPPGSIELRDGQIYRWRA